MNRISPDYSGCRRPLTYIAYAMRKSYEVGVIHHRKSASYTYAPAVTPFCKILLICSGLEEMVKERCKLLDSDSPEFAEHVRIL